MPGSHASVFGEAEDFQAALSADGVAGLLVTSRGQFRARLTQLTLDGWRLATVEEEQPRIAFVAVPAGMVLVSFPIGEGPSPVWAGVEIRNGEMITLGPACACTRERSDCLTGAPFTCQIISLPTTVAC